MNDNDKKYLMDEESAKKYQKTVDSFHIPAFYNLLIKEGKLTEAEYFEKVLPEKRLKKIEKQIAELRESVDYFKPLQNVSSLINQINELKEEFNEHLHGEYVLLEGLRGLHELMRGLVSDLQDSNSLSKATIKCYEGKLVKNLKKLDSDPVQNRIDRLDAGFKILKEHEKGIEHLKTEKKEGINDYIVRTMIDHSHDEGDKKHANFIGELKGNNSGSEKELGLPKRENGLKHSHGKSEGNSPLLNSKPPEPDKGCFNCYYFIDSGECNNRHAFSYKKLIYTTFVTGICNNYRPIKKTLELKDFDEAEGALKRGTKNG